MRLSVPREDTPGERRVAAVPDTVATYVGWGWDVVVETGAGAAAGHPDESYEAAGAVVGDPTGADIVLTVAPPGPERLAAFAPGTVVVGFLEPFTAADAMQAMVDRSLTAVAVEAIPRTTLAQSMDALSSQANIAGYAAVLLGAGATPRIFPMMMTAAGTIAPSKVVVLGAGVAGLQAIATARRLGAMVHAYDVRTDTKEQVESLGGRFIEAVTTDADGGGYATEVEADVQRRQQEALAPFVAAADVVVTTAQIPGRPAPLLVTEEMVASMSHGSVIVDMAAGTGGNVAGSLPDEVVTVSGVAIHGPTNLASQHAADASRMYSRNIVALLTRVRDLGKEDGRLITLDDEIVGTASVIVDGEVRHPRTAALLGLEGSS